MNVLNDTFKRYGKILDVTVPFCSFGPASPGTRDQDKVGTNPFLIRLTIIMACIIYWQAKEIGRVIQECDPEAADIDLSLLEHISPLGWKNIILYGEYVFNRSLVRS